MDPWRVLGVPRYSSADECRRAFQARALKLHPDVNPSPAAARDFQLLREAYEFLKEANFSAGSARQQQQQPYHGYGQQHPFGGADPERQRARAEAFRAMQAAARAAEAEAEAMAGGRSSSARAPRPSAQLRALHMALDFVFQPRVLLVAIPVLAYMSYTMLTDLAHRASGGSGGGSGKGEELIMAVWRKEDRRWELPQHRDYFHERLVLVRRDMIHKPGGAPAERGSARPQMS